MKHYLAPTLACLLLGCAEVEPPTEHKRSPAAESGAEMPCAIATVLHEKCGSCHSNPPRENAPMPLTTWPELHAPAHTRLVGTERVFEQVALRIHAVDRPMPPPDRAPLTDAELSILDVWLSAKAPPGRACAVKVTASDAGAKDAAGPGAPRVPETDAAIAVGDPSRADAGSPSVTPPRMQPSAADSDAGARKPPTRDAATTTTIDSVMLDQPVVPSDDECEYVEFRARSDASGTPYRVAADARDDMRCFIFDHNLPGPMQALSFVPLPGNDKVLDHWVLYSLESIGTRDVVARCEWPAGYRVLAAGAPGSDAWNLPADVGIEVGRGLFMLEAHYNNADNPETTDQSGVRVCLSNRLRPKVASVSWLGVEAFSIPANTVDYAVANRCRPGPTEPIHLLRVWPHMHPAGTRAGVRVDRADGTSQSLHNAPFMVDAQRSYPIPVVLEPGDSLVTQCFYNNPSDRTLTTGVDEFGELCNHFVVAYPAYALTNSTPSWWNVSCLGSL
jgi:hypothetical protein